MPNPGALARTAFQLLRCGYAIFVNSPRLDLEFRAPGNAGHESRTACRMNSNKARDTVPFPKGSAKLAIS